VLSISAHSLAQKATHTLPTGSAIDAEVKQVLARTHANGLALIDHGKVVYVQAYGIRNAKGEPLTTLRGCGFKRGNNGVESVTIPQRAKSNAPLPSHRNSHHGSEAWRDPLGTPESLCRQPREKRIWRGVDAFEVADLASELAGREILIPPNSPSDGVRVAFIVENGAPIELLEFTDPNHPGRRRQSKMLGRQGT
jgi:hypothetical protein